MTTDRRQGRSSAYQALLDREMERQLDAQAEYVSDKMEAAQYERELEIHGTDWNKELDNE